EKVRRVSGVPLALTGGLRSPAVMESVLASGAVDVIGVARPLALDPDFCRKAVAGEVERAADAEISTGIRMFDDMLQSVWHQEQFKLMADGREPNPSLNKWIALARGLANIFGPR
ncbi:MAG: hypothetical protein RLZZ303_451, partial [Candidatus Hydrogenedentota bacterium]